MHKFLALAGVAGLLLFMPARADASCCGHKVAAEPSAIDMLMAMDPQLNPAPPVNQKTEVWFHRPALVGRVILQGRYVIEHDNDRMARGEPCTYIYAYDDQTTPVVTFHCTHLERDRAGANTVVLHSTGEGTWQKLTEFQFAGETAAHGVPTVR